MKTIGIIGGLGPESTLDYYKGIIRAVQQSHPDLAYPEIIVYSADLNGSGFLQDPCHKCAGLIDIKWNTDDI